MYVVWFRLRVTLLWGPNDLQCMSFGSFGRLDSMWHTAFLTWVLPHAIPFTLRLSAGLTWQILTIFGKLNFYMSSSVPLQKHLHCNFWNYLCCMYITPQSSANAARCHGYYKTKQIYILIAVTIPLLSRFHCYNPTIVTIPLLQPHFVWSYCYNSIVVTIPLLQSHCCHDFNAFLTEKVKGK